MDTAICQSVKRRIEANTIRVPESGCWIWMLSVNHNGYGHIAITGSKTGLAHRLSYEAHIGPIPEELFVLHRCDVRTCCNPNHLFIGGHLENARDRVAKGRNAKNNGVKGEKHYLAKLTDSAVRAIRCDHRPQTAIARDYGVTQTLISQVQRRKIWAHVQGA